MLLITERENGAFLKECQSRMQKWLNEQHVKEHSPDTPIHPQTLARMVSDLADEHAIVCCDTGAVTVWGARNFRIKEQQRFTLSGGLASMGYGLPAAIGAQVEYPDRQVIALCGDGGFAMLMADFASAVKYQLPVKIFIFNNSKLGLIQMEEEASSGNPESETELHNPDYALFARACGGEGFNVENPTDLESVIARALESPGPSIVNVFVDAGELVLPPEVSTVQAVNYVKAKVKEYFLN
jgi:thiamine pyrophosphate-dependent acetolactate synthase large subunit-like protein